MYGHWIVEGEVACQPYWHILKEEVSYNAFHLSYTKPYVRDVKVPELVNV